MILNLTAVLGQGVALNQNQHNVVNTLNAFFNNGGTLPPNFVSVFGLTGGNLAGALTQFSGEAAAGAQHGAFKLMDQFLALMLDPFVDGRARRGRRRRPSPLRPTPSRYPTTWRSPIEDHESAGDESASAKDTDLRATLGRVGLPPMAAATAPAAIRRWSAAMISPPAPRASPPGSTIA